MHRVLRIIRKAKKNPDGSIEWELGEDATLPAEEAGTKQHTVPARQMDMCRDALVAALFGPASASASSEQLRMTS